MQETAATRIDALRRVRGIPVTEFVRAVGISRQVYYDRMHGAAWPDHQLAKAAELLETSPQALRFGPEAVFLPEDQAALERIVHLLLDTLNDRGVGAEVDLVARMTTHLYGIHARGGQVDQATVESLLRLALK